jgi:hypothetical protein
VRAAYIKYANNPELPTLADKLDFMFKSKLVPNAGKTKIKTSDEEVTHLKITNLCAYRNNLSWLSKLLKNTVSSTLCTNILEEASQITHFKRIPH